MAKKSSASSRRAKLISVSAESIFGKPLNKRQKGVLARIGQRQAAGDDFDIDYSDIPPLTDEQLAQFRRAPKVLVAARLGSTRLLDNIAIDIGATTGTDGHPWVGSDNNHELPWRN